MRKSKSKVSSLLRKKKIFWNFPLLSSEIFNIKKIWGGLSNGLVWKYFPPLFLHLHPPHHCHATINTAAQGLGCPRISSVVPGSSLGKDQSCTCQAMSTVSSKVTFPLCCLMLFCLFLSLGCSLRVLISKAEAESTPSIRACLLWMVSFTVILRPFQSPVALVMPSPTLPGDWKLLEGRDWVCFSL